MQFDAEDNTYAAQLRVFLSPFDAIWEAQPSVLAHSWLFDRACLANVIKYFTQVDAYSKPCAETINMRLGLGGEIAIPLGPRVAFVNTSDIQVYYYDYNFE